jgi:hypothetical protein
MYRHGLGTRQTERVSMNHIDDVMNILMFAIETTSSHMMIRLDVVDLVRVITNTM